jgi:hypothetical protein
MATAYNSGIFASTYRDDYNDSDAYYRILFNAGRALQARELTQLQTIINKEMERFGKNIFKEGACVSGSTVTINKSYDYIKLNTDTGAGGLALPADTSTLIDAEYTGATSGVTFRILEYYTAAQTGAVDTIYVQYIGGNSSGTYIKAADNETLENASVGDIKSASTSATGTGTRISFGDGAFFTQGHFVYSSAQSLILSYYSNSYSGNVGFKVTQDIVTAGDNSALYDNQGATPNTSAPGADRYRIRLTLIDEADVGAAEDFIFYCKVKQSEIVSQISATDNYNKINDLLAKRTYEESGNYIVKPFKATFSLNDSDANYLDLDVSPGVAYVNGYRAETQTANTLAIAKPQTYVSEANVNIPVVYGNYVLSDSGTHTDIINFATLDSATLFNSANAAVGKARIRAIEEDGTKHRLYIFDTKMYSGKNFETDVLSIGASPTNDFAIEQEVLNGVAKSIIKQPRDNNVFFDLPRKRPKELSDITMTEQRYLSATSNGSGQYTVTVSAPSALADTSLWVATLADGSIIGPTIVSSAATSVTIGGLGTSAAFDLAYYVTNTITQRTKTLTTTTKTSTASGDYVDSDGISYLNLGQADLYDVLAIQDSAGGTAVDIADNFIIDNGQRDNYYQPARLILKSGLSKPSATYCQFRYFAHGTGDFYSVNSYDGQVSYGNIPSHTSPVEGIIELRDVLDFRPTKSAIAGTIATLSDVNPLPRNGDTITADIETYQPRSDKLVIDENGVLINVQGTPDFNPKFPNTPDGTLELYRIALNANTINDSDVVLSPIDAKRYTMNDISKLDKQVQRLEELTALSLLEVDTKNLQVLDSTGNARTKAGFLVDNFSDQAFAQTADAGYSASIDPGEKILRPSFHENNIRLIYNADSSSNVTKVGDLVMLSYDSAEYQAIDICSGTENVNPFNVTSSRGNITLSPASDEWREVKQTGQKVVQGGTKLDTTQAYLWNNWEWNWGGKNIEDLEVGDDANRSLTSSTPDRDYRTAQARRADMWGDQPDSPRYNADADERANPTKVNRIVSSETIREVIGNKVVDVALIPWIRSRKIYFKVGGLRPNTKYYPYFDNKAIDSWVREETFVNFSSDTTDYGNQYDAATSHPEGSSSLVSDTNGAIEGSFFIPHKQFKTGTRQFKLLDISGGLDNQALSVATATYEAKGTIETVQETVKTTRVLNVLGEETTTSNSKKVKSFVPSVGKLISPLRTGPTTFTADNTLPDANLTFSDFGTRSLNDAFFGNKMMRTRCGYRDPLAQSFLVNDLTGVFLTKVKVYFATKDSTLPVTLQIRPMENGHPHSTKYIATKTLTSSQVTTVSTQTVAGVLAAPTSFELDEPVYLSPQEEYAVVLLADSNKYTVYVSEVGQFQLGSTSKRITTQPSLGSLFKSQNGRTWEPDQKKDLTMKLIRASFNKTSGDVRLRNANVPAYRLDPNPIKTTAGDSDIILHFPDHGLDSGDTFEITGLTAGTSYGGVLGSVLDSTHTVKHFDASGIVFSVPAGTLAPTKSTYSGGSNVKVTDRNIQFNLAKVDIQTMVPDLTGLALRGKFTSGRSIAGSETRMAKDTAWSALRFNRNTSFSAPKMIANRTRENLVVGSEGLGGNYSSEISVPISTTNNFVSPIVDLQRASMTLIGNHITDTTVDKFTIEDSAETVATNGKEVARHISIPATLANASVGIKVFLAVNRPSAASVDLYYRVGGENTNLDQVNWILLEPQSTPAPDDNPTIFRDYEYLAGGQNGVLDPFTRMQFKIVMRSTSSSRVPKLRDFRAIAMID